MPLSLFYSWGIWISKSKYLSHAHMAIKWWSVLKTFFNLNVSFLLCYNNNINLTSLIISSIQFSGVRYILIFLQSSLLSISRNFSLFQWKLYTLLWIRMYSILFESLPFIILGIYTKVEELDHMVILCLIFLEPPYFFYSGCTILLSYQ